MNVADRRTLQTPDITTDYVKKKNNNIAPASSWESANTLRESDLERERERE